GRLSTVELRAFPQGQGAVFARKIASTGSRKQITLPFAGDWKPDFLDLAFVVDTTGSMADELDWLTRELRGIVRAAQRSAPGVSIRYGLIVYRDTGDDYVVRNFGFTNRQSQMVGWLRNQHASGGGDYPEAAAAALAAGASLDWRRGKGERLMFHIADAPPHDRDARAYLAAARHAARNNVQIFGLGASGVAAESEYLMRQAAMQTGGRYLFLTDDSGVGYGHAEPTISCYRVTALNDLMVRVLRSELSGRRIEATDSAVIRSVGSYQAGVCRN
ncbi:MAG: VWA domain-containing protein, partial [Marinosulfonomonas sp.]|nr:VWA domain-containing protein [Marinosulfonomonas sp.]